MTHPFPNSERLSFDLDAEGVGLLRLSRPDKLNALDPQMFDDLIAAAASLHGMRGLRCVVLTGDGRGFCAGLDLASMTLLTGPDAPDLRDRTHGPANQFQQAAMAWRSMPVPVIAAIHGVCFGGGLQLASGADIRVVAPDARLSIMEMKWGIIPDMAGHVLWRGNVRDDVLRELTYTNREFSGEEAVSLGIATMVDVNPLPRAMVIAKKIAQRNPAAIRAAKSLFNRHRAMESDAVLMEESVLQMQLLGSNNQLEAVAAQMEKRAPRFSDQ